MKTIVFATKNQGKLIEIRSIMEDMPVNILSMEEAGIDIDVVEDGKTFADNALIKAKTIMEQSGLITLADDSGLEVDYLDKAPGVYSARFMGEHTSYDIKNQYILDQLKDVPREKRTARFVSVIAAALPDGKTLIAPGVIEGIIGYEIKGSHGFGYDPIFYVPSLGKTTAELDLDEKNAISHRGRALRAMKELLKEVL